MLKKKNTINKLSSKQDFDSLKLSEFRPYNEHRTFGLQARPNDIEKIPKPSNIMFEWWDAQNVLSNERFWVNT